MDLEVGLVCQLPCARPRMHFESRLDSHCSDLNLDSVSHTTQHERQKREEIKMAERLKRRMKANRDVSRAAPRGGGNFVWQEERKIRV